MNSANDQDYEDATEHLELSTQDARERLRNKNLLNDAVRFTTKYIDKQYREARRSFETSNSRSNTPYHQPDVSRRFSNTSREKTPSGERISYCVVQRSPDGNPLTKHCCSWKEKRFLEGDQSVNIVQNTRRDVTYNYSQDASVKYKPDDNDTSFKQATKDRHGNPKENINHDTFSTPLQSLENKSLYELFTARQSEHCDDINAEAAKRAQNHHPSTGQRSKTLQRTVLERVPFGEVTCTCVCQEPGLLVSQAANECSYKMEGPMCNHIKDRMRYYNQLPESGVVEPSQNGVKSEISPPTVTVSLNDIGKPSKPAQPSENSTQPSVEVKNRLLSPPPYSATDPAVDESEINQPKVDQMRRSVGIYGSPVDASVMGIPMDFSLRGSPVDFSHLGTAVDSGLRAGALSRPKTTMKKPKRQQSRDKTFLYSSKSKDFQNGEIREDRLGYSKSSSAIPSGTKSDSWESDPTIALLSNIPSATRSRPTFAKKYQKTRSPLSKLPDKISLPPESGSKVDIFAQDLSISDDSIEDEQVATVQKAMETVYRSSFSNDILRNFYGFEPSDTPSIASDVDLPEPVVLRKPKPALSKEPQVFDDDFGLESFHTQEDVKSEQVTDVPINDDENLEKTKETEGDFTDVQKHSTVDLHILDDLQADEKSEHFFSSVNVAPQNISDHSEYVDADNNAAFESQNSSTHQPPLDDTVTDDINANEFHDVDETIAEVKPVKTFAEHLESMNQELLKVLSPAKASTNQPVHGVEDRNQIKSLNTPLTKPSVVDCKVSAIPGYYQPVYKSEDMTESRKLNAQKSENEPRNFDMSHPTLETDVKNSNTTSPPEKPVKFINEQVATDAIPSYSNTSKMATPPFSASTGETSADYASTDNIPSASPSVYPSSPDRHSVVSSFGDLNSPSQRLAGTESHLTWDYTLSGDKELNVSMIPLIGSSNMVKPPLADSIKTMEGGVQKVELQGDLNNPTTLLIVRPMKASNDAFASPPLLEMPSKITKDQVCQATITDSSYPGSSDVDTTLVSPFKQFNVAPKPSSKPDQKLYKIGEKDALRFPPQNVNPRSADNDHSVHLNSYSIDIDITEQIENLKKATESSSREPTIPPENQLQKDLDNTLTNNDVVSAINTSDLGQVILPRRYSHVSTPSLTDIDITYFPSSTTTSNGNSSQPMLGKNKQDATTFASSTSSTQLSPYKPHRTVSQPIKILSTQRISNQITQFPSNTTAAVLSSPTGQDINLQVNDIPQLNDQSTQYSLDVAETHQKPAKNLPKTSGAAQERLKIRSSSAIGRIKSACSATNKKKKNLNSCERSPHKLHSSNCEADRMAHESASDASSADSERRVQRSRERQKSKSKINENSTPFLITKRREYSKKSALRSSKSKSQHRQVTINDGKKSVEKRSRTHNIRRVVSTESELPTDSEIESGAALPLDRLERPLQQNAGIQTRYTSWSSEGSAYSDDETARNQRGTTSPLSGHHSASSDDKAIHTDIKAGVTTSDINQKVEGEEEWGSAGQIDKLLAINNHMKDLLNTLEVERDAHHNNRASSSSDNSNSISLGTMKANKSLEDSIIASLVNKIGAKMNAIAGRLERKGEYPKAEAIGEANILYQNLAGLINKTRSGSVERLDYSQKELGQLLTTVACSLLSLCVYLKQPSSLPPSSTTHRLKDEVTDTESLTSLPEIPPKNIISKPHVYQLPGPELDLQMDSKPKEKSTRTKTQNRLYGLNEANRVLASKYSTEFPSSRRQAKPKLPTKGGSKASLLKSVRRNQSILKASINKGGLTIQYSKHERSKPASSNLQNTYGVATLPSRRSRMEAVPAERNSTQSKQNKTYVSGRTDHSHSILKDRKISQSEPKFRTKSSSLRKPSLDQY